VTRHHGRVQRATRSDGFESAILRSDMWRFEVGDVGRSLDTATHRVAAHRRRASWRCLARDASRARTTTTRMDDTRDATVTLALDACSSPTAIARTASSSASASDDAVTEEAAIVCVRVHDLFEAFTDDAVMDVINACAEGDARTLAAPIAALRDAVERRALDALERRRGAVRLVVDERAMDDASPDARRAWLERILDAEDAKSLAYQALAFGDDDGAKAYLKRATIRDAARERAFAARVTASCASVVREAEIVQDLVDLQMCVDDVKPASSAKEMLEHRDRKRRRCDTDSRDGDSRARASKSPLGSPSRACTARKAS